MTKNGTKRGLQQYICKGCGSTSTAPAITTPAEIKKPGLSEVQMRARYDLNFKAQAACESLERGVYLTTAEFVQLCGIRPGAGYRGIIDHPDYDKYRGRAGGQVYFSHPESIKKLKEEGILQ